MARQPHSLLTGQVRWPLLVLQSTKYNQGESASLTASKLIMGSNGGLHPHYSIFGRSNLPEHGIMLKFGLGRGDPRRPGGLHTLFDSLLGRHNSSGFPEQLTRRLSCAAQLFTSIVREQSVRSRSEYESVVIQAEHVQPRTATLQRGTIVSVSLCGLRRIRKHPNTT